MNKELDKKELNKHFKQRLQRVHSIVGITVSLFMYIAIFFGIFAIFLPYIEAWEKPSRHFKMPNIENINYSKMIDSVLADPDYPKINGVNITLPGYAQDPAIVMYADFTKNRVFNPNTAQEMEDEGEQTQLGWFLNSMHYGGSLRTFGYWLFGLMAVAVMFLIIGGVIQSFLIKYKDTGKNAQGKFSKWHRKIFLWLFAPLIIVTLTGALMNIGYTLSAPLTYIASKGQTHEQWRLTRPILYPKLERVKKKNDSVPMLSINKLIKKAQEINPNLKFLELYITNWKDSTAEIKLVGYNPKMPFLNGISNNPYVTLNGFDGSLIEQQRVLDKHWSGIFYDAIYFLHFLFGVDIFTRLLIAIIMLLSLFALSFGVLLHLEKKAKKFPKNIPIYQGLGKISLTVMIGVLPATAILFTLQWLLPFDLQDRFLWQKGAFAILWTATLTWSFYRLNSYQAAREFLFLAGILFLISPFIHFYASGFSPIKLFEEQMYAILSIDCGLFIFALILLLIAIKLPIKREKIQTLLKKIL